MRQADRQRQAARGAPSYWAPFILVGEGGASKACGVLGGMPHVFFDFTTELLQRSQNLHLTGVSFLKHIANVSFKSVRRLCVHILQYAAGAAAAAAHDDDARSMRVIEKLAPLWWCSRRETA